MTGLSRILWLAFALLPLSASADTVRIYVTNSADWEGFPTLAYNSAQDEYLVAYYCEPSGKSGASAEGLDAI